MDNSGTHEFSIIDLSGPWISFSSQTNRFVTESPMNFDFLKGLSLNTDINASSGWWAQLDAFVTANFPTGTDTYLGARFDLNSNTHYGWVKVNWDGNGTFIVKDYAYESTPDIAIAASDMGSGSAGIPELSDNSFIIYPTPSSDFISIETTNETEIQMTTIYSFDGKIIYNSNLNNPKKSIDIRSFPKGGYMVVLSFDDGSTYSKNFVKN